MPLKRLDDDGDNEKEEKETVKHAVSMKLDHVWLLCFMAYQPSWVILYQILFMICKWVVRRQHFYAIQSLFVCTHLIGLKYSYQTLIILFTLLNGSKYYNVILIHFNVNLLFAHNSMVSS